MRRFEKAFQERGVQIALIAFGTPHWARIFLDEAGVDFPLLLDPERRVYKAYGLDRSLMGAYSPQVIWYYLKAIFSGRKVRLSSQGDVLQLGGDFLLDGQGRIVMAHRSREPTDRPSPQAILQAWDQSW